MFKDIISIIIPVYKVKEKYLRKCIESAINQTYSNIEVILVDDGTPDNCGDICDEYAFKSNKVKVIHQENTGLSAARNRGVRESNGEWIMFLDGDDYIDLNTCELVSKACDIQDLDIICFSYIRENNNKTKICELNGLDERVYIGNECEYLMEKVLDYHAHFSTAYCKLIRKQYILDNNIFHNEILKQGAEGIEFNIRLFEKVNKVLILKKYLYHYIYNDMSISNKHDEKNHYYVLSCFDEIKKYIEKCKNSERLLQMLYNRMLNVISTIAISGYFSPQNKEHFKDKVKKYKGILDKPIVKESIKNATYLNIDLPTKIIVYCIKYNLYKVINVLAFIRYKQKKR